MALCDAWCRESQPGQTLPAFEIIAVRLNLDATFSVCVYAVRI